MLDAYAAAGGNFIDTADVYSAWVAGNARRRVGDDHRQLDGGARQPRRDGRRHQGRHACPAPTGLARRHDPRRGRGLAAAPAAPTTSTSTTRTSDDPDTPLEETLGGVRRAGPRRARCAHIAASNYTRRACTRGARRSRPRGPGRYVALQPHYNLVERGPTRARYAEIVRRRTGLACRPVLQRSPGAS